MCSERFVVDGAVVVVVVVLADAGTPGLEVAVGVAVATLVVPAAIEAIAIPVAVDLSRSMEDLFEVWLREFHNDRGEEWYVHNHDRLSNSFRSIWEEEAGRFREAASVKLTNS